MQYRKLSTISLIFLLCASLVIAPAYASDLSDLQERMKEVTAQVDDYNAQVAELEEKISESESELSDLEARESELDSQVHERLRAIYITGNDGYLEFLFSSEDFTTLISNFDITQKIIGADFDAIRELAATRQAAEETKASLESQKDELAAKMSESEALQEELAKEIAKYGVSVESLSEDYSGQGTVSTAATAGELASSGWTWPVDASATNAFLITSLMGTRESPGGIGSSDHGGTDIGCGYGSTIVAAQSGTVTQAGANGGYGLCVTVQTTDGYTVMYGHLSAIYVAEGQTVTAGQPLGACGSTGNSTGAHLHFEVRSGSEKINGLAFYGNDILGRLSYSLDC